MKPIARTLAIASLFVSRLGTPAAAQPASAGPATIDLRRHQANASRVVPMSKPRGAIRITFEPVEWPNASFRAPEGRPWDWSKQSILLLDLSNPERRAIEFGIRVDDDPSADGHAHCRSAMGQLKPGESATFSFPLDTRVAMSQGMRGLPEYAGARSLSAYGEGPFSTAHIVVFQVFLHAPTEPRTLEIRSAGVAPAISLNGIVDAFGQYAKAEWPGKIRSESDLVERHKVEAADLNAHRVLPGRDRFGGWGDGPKQAATGFFRTAKLDGNWWLVDPDGALFLSLGIDTVSRHESTIITGRESMFAALPKPGTPLAKHFGAVGQIHSGPVHSGKTFNFYEANLERVYGPDFARRWKETTLARLKSWGFNTIGNWSDQGLHGARRIPYVATAGIYGGHARVGSGSDYWGKMHDPFDPRFAVSVANSLRGVVAAVKGDPWCLGYFVDNELSWGGFGDENGRYGLALGALSLPAETSPAKRALLVQVKRKYGDISRLNSAWGTALGGWPALDGPWKPAAKDSDWTSGFKSDLAAFVKELARTYFQTVRRQLKSADPDHLYLGCRFAWRTQEAVAAAGEFCDVVSFNIYDRRVDPKKWAILATLDRPSIIGEFHVGALDRGMFHAGLVSSANQEERARVYADYVSSVLDNPNLVGCHWFQYIDEPLIGRSYDGENYNIGFLTVTDTPYPELVAAARKIHREAYSRRSTNRSKGQQAGDSAAAAVQGAGQLKAGHAVPVDGGRHADTVWRAEGLDPHATRVVHMPGDHPNRAPRSARYGGVPQNIGELLDQERGDTAVRGAGLQNAVRE